MARSKSSKKWLEEHFQDPYVQLAKDKGYRSRAAFKLLEINEKDQILKKGMTVIDLGATPGGWSQVAKDCVGEAGRVVALDILPMSSLGGVEFIQGDFTEQASVDALMTLLNGEKADVLISDMAPNTSGIESVDIPKAMYLVELAIELSDQVLKTGGALLIKVFYGSGIEECRAALKSRFQKLSTRKPKASRSRSKEAYLLGTGYNL